jgi:hypothetical protein
MKRVTLRQALAVYCAAAGSVAGFALLRENHSASDQRSMREHRAITIVRRAPADAAKAVLESNPFLMPSISGSVNDGGRPDFPAPSSAPLDTRMPHLGRLRLSAIIGPPWRAVLSREMPGAGPLIVEAGDSVQQSRVQRIVADTVILKKGSAVSRRVIGESWEP